MDVLFEQQPTHQGSSIGIITLNSEKTLNALTLASVEAMLHHLQNWAQDPSVVCVVLRAEGQKAFCAGADVRRLAKACLEQPGHVPQLAAQFFETEYRLDYLLHCFPKPVIAWGHGYVMGGGMGLLQGASIRIVTPSSRLAMPEINIGLYPDAGASWFLPRLPGKLGLFLGLTGVQINAQDALDWGLADRLLPEDQYEALLQGLRHINWAQQPELQLNALLQSLAVLAQAQHPEAWIAPRRARIEQLLDTTELPLAWEAFRRLSEDADPFLAQAAQQLIQGCPMTAQLVWEQMQRARHLSLAEAFQMEYTISINCCRHPEFSEGVRAKLIDKDQKPRWHWADINDIPLTVVQAHFQPIGTHAHPLAQINEG